MPVTPTPPTNPNGLPTRGDIIRSGHRADVWRGFARDALVGMVQADNRGDPDADDLHRHDFPRHVAAVAGKYADAMLAEYESRKF